MYLGNKNNDKQRLGEKRTGSIHFFGNKKTEAKKSNHQHNQSDEDERREPRSDLERYHH